MYENEARDSEAEHEEEMRTNREFKIWRKNIPKLYSMMVSHALEWPSLSVQMFPDAVRDEERETTSQKLLVSTHTSGKEEEYLMILNSTLPDTLTEETLEVCDGKRCGPVGSKIKVIQKIPVPREINRTRYMPLNSNVIAARTDAPEVLVYDYTKHTSFPKEAVPDAVLEGHTKGGYGLVWHPSQEGVLFTAGEDQAVCTFDVSSGGKLTGCLKQEESINDISLSPEGDCMVLGLGVSGAVVVDRRDGGKKVLRTGATHCAQFSLDNVHLVATGGENGSVQVFDLRNEGAPLHVLDGHEGKEITQVQWSPHFPSVLASGSANKRVVIWDLDKIGAPQTEEDKEDGPPELLFVHAGHTNTVSDICWNPQEPWEIATVGEDCMVQMWQISADILEGEEDEEGEEEGEEQ
ncbi:histone-binding protein RBBP4 [Nematocida sp. AWRm77]|nr:histone-binding protein RBBP4 [Nematocida sp. AWRm77]